MAHTPGKSYTFEDIQNEYAAEPAPLCFVVHKGTQVLGLRLRADLNPKIYDHPAEVWVGAGPLVASWGQRLASHAGPIPLYVSPKPGADYCFLGYYQVLKRAHTAEELEGAMKTPGVGELSRIVFLVPA